MSGVQYSSLHPAGRPINLHQPSRAISGGKKKINLNHATARLPYSQGLGTIHSPFDQQTLPHNLSFHKNMLYCNFCKQTYPEFLSPSPFFFKTTVPSLITVLHRSDYTNSVWFNKSCQPSQTKHSMTPLHTSQYVIYLLFPLTFLRRTLDELE